MDRNRSSADKVAALITGYVELDVAVFTPEGYIADRILCEGNVSVPFTNNPQEAARFFDEATAHGVMRTLDYRRDEYLIAYVPVSRGLPRIVYRAR